MTNHINTLHDMGSIIWILATSPIPLFFLLLGCIAGVYLLARKLA